MGEMGSLSFLITNYYYFISNSSFVKDVTTLHFDSIGGPEQPLMVYDDHNILQPRR